MAKTFLEFEGKIIDVFRIIDIEKIDEWNDEKQIMDFVIYFSRNLEENPMIKTYKFVYADESFRNDRFDELVLRLEDLEHITFC